MKAIHNYLLGSFLSRKVVINRKTTKFKSNSQRFDNVPHESLGCYQSQNYKIWNQFTTVHLDETPPYVVINHKTTKFESNSQLLERIEKLEKRCYQSQNDKIWKQFTTSDLYALLVFVMLSITKLQNLKAIHNISCYFRQFLWDVINRKTTKFESNSQRSSKAQGTVHGCYQSQNYKNWKQFTTTQKQTEGFGKLLSITKLQNLKAIHNRAYAYR